MGVLVIQEPGVRVVEGVLRILEDLKRSVKEYARQREIEKAILDLENPLQRFMKLAEEFAYDVRKGKDVREWLRENIPKIWEIKMELFINLRRAMEVLPEFKGRTFNDVVEEVREDTPDEDIRMLMNIIRHIEAEGLATYLQQNIESLSADMLDRMINLFAIVDFLALVITLSDEGKINLPDTVRILFREYLNEFAEFWEDIAVLKEMEENETGEFVSEGEIMAILGTEVEGTTEDGTVKRDEGTYR